ncbi:GNAT family N-acetyltransferase [Anaerocolumna sp. AGMB13020]|uniref:GNAT family N-acetyltransferase n=1 Tax=Anaerocolumna sp. AGMB13020 TaxID=3081750 RepID=UPI002954FA13|nr:GNAT family N-acetyltransferase [Anaerocolumna sp. AGMB13020]WOO38107.1 GNAT family N-acetyltransferase [Anaerocolumna sp. AGMB13020]
MIKIRQLTVQDMQKAVELKVLCWPEELAGLSAHNLSLEKELEYWTGWMNAGEEQGDIRVLLGAFEEEELRGVAFASFAEQEDIPEKGIELNGLWVYQEHRRRGIALMLLTAILGHYLELGREQMVIYNFHASPSNQFYRKFGAVVKRQDIQLMEKLPVDVCYCDLKEMKAKIEESLRKYIET